MREGGYEIDNCCLFIAFELVNKCFSVKQFKKKELDDLFQVCLCLASKFRQIGVYPYTTKNDEHQTYLEDYEMVIFKMVGNNVNLVTSYHIMIVAML